MTRENKLALVIGFGLMLFVGILVSDHFSAQRFDPATVAQVEEPAQVDVIQLETFGEQALAPVVSPAPGSVDLAMNGNSQIPGAPTAEEIVVISPNDPAGPVALAVETAVTDGTPVRFYKVRKGDTFWQIAKREYGDGSVGDKLKEYNKAVAPDAARLAIDSELRLPPIEVLKPGAAAPAAASATAVATAKPAAPRAPATYTVRKGDTAYAIARKQGVKVADLLQQNGIKDPAALKPGQSIRIPSKTF
jgi:nucleoid-associated protein YgaU